MRTDTMPVQHAAQSNEPWYSVMGKQAPTTQRVAGSETPVGVECGA